MVELFGAGDLLFEGRGERVFFLVTLGDTLIAIHSGVLRPEQRVVMSWWRCSGGFTVSMYDRYMSTLKLILGIRVPSPLKFGHQTYY